MDIFISAYVAPRVVRKAWKHVSLANPWLFEAAIMLEGPISLEQFQNNIGKAGIQETNYGVFCKE